MNKPLPYVLGLVLGAAAILAYNWWGWIALTIALILNLGILIAMVMKAR